jgi:hypothetical protein
MRSSFAARGGHLLKSPNYRHQVARRRLMAAGAVLALALASGVVGTLSARQDGAATNAATGPFSYFPQQ